MLGDVFFKDNLLLICIAFLNHNLDHTYIHLPISYYKMFDLNYINI